MGFGISAADVLLLSAGFPKVKLGGGCSDEATGLPKENPPEFVGAADVGASASLLVAPKTNEDRAEGAATSFFSSGFPKANVGAAELSLFSSEATGLKLTEDPVVVVVVVVVVVSDFFSSGFDSPNVKPAFAVSFSVLLNPVPNATPLVEPNLKPEPVAGCSDFLSSLEATPNLKPSDELPNLNPGGAEVSLEVVSVEIPNLNPPDDEEDVSEDEVPNLTLPSDVPNLKPAELNTELLSDVPNLKPPEPEVEEPNVEEPKPEENRRITGLDKMLYVGYKCI